MAHCANHPLANPHRSHAGVHPFHRASAHLNGLVRLWRLWRQRAREQRLAAQFTDRDLWDVGLTRGDIHREFSRPFWEVVAGAAPHGSVQRETQRHREIAMLDTHEGGCHCGRVRFRVRADLSLVTECNCSVCAKKGILHLVVPPEQFELLSGQDELTTYQFNTNTAKHIFCRNCGIHSFGVPRSAPDKISVNARCLDGVDVAALRPRLFDGLHWEETMRARRAAGGA